MNIRHKFISEIVLQSAIIHTFQSKIYRATSIKETSLVNREREILDIFHESILVTQFSSTIT